MIDYKDRLNLSDDQVKTVQKSLLAFQALVKTQRSNLRAYEQEYQELLKNEAPLPDIKSKLRQIAETRFLLRYADVLTSRRVSNALTKEQMAEWKAIQSEVRGRDESLRESP
jgi:hypothetical protein